MTENQPKCPPHRYKRRNLTKNKNKEPFYVFACVECPSTIRIDMAAGREARCFNCNDTFIITAKQASKMAKLRCDNCIKHKSETLQVKRDIDELLEKILDEI